MQTTIHKNETPSMFSKIAPRYDMLNHVLSFNVDRVWRRELVNAAALPADGRVLDACTGTADVAINFGRVLKTGHVVGVDRSHEMLEIGRKKIRKHHLEQRVELMEGDVLDLPFDDDSFDAVTVAFGLRNLPDYQAGVSEMTRVLKPGGKLLVLEFCPPSGGNYLKGYNFYLRNVLPVVGGVISGSREAYRYLASSIGDFLTREQILGMMTNAALDNPAARRLAGGIAYTYTGVKRGGA